MNKAAMSNSMLSSGYHHEWIGCNSVEQCVNYYLSLLDDMV